VKSHEEQVCRPPTWAASGWASIALLSLCACGGAPDPDRATVPSTSPAEARPAALTPALGVAAAAETGPGAAPNATAPRAAVTKTVAPPEYMLVVFKQKVVHRDNDELAPVHGAGYEPLRAFVYLRGKPRKQSPANEVQPYCVSTTQCEYRPPRKAGLAEKITISLDDDSVARLSAADDMVVISARTLEVARPSIVKVTMTIAGQAPVTRQILYAKPTPEAS
jgi:hypothetical protein